jgi:hypothetical protein
MYTAHIDQAARYAALALALPARRGDAAAVAALRDDLAVLLAGTTRLVTALDPHLPIAVDASDVGRHPVQAMLNRLSATPSLGGAGGSAERPSSRWAGRPDSPSDVGDAVAAWKGLVVSAQLARADLDSGPELTDTRAVGRRR